MDIGYREELSDRCMNGWKEALKERLEEERKENEIFKKKKRKKRKTSED